MLTNLHPIVKEAASREILGQWQIQKDTGKPASLYVILKWCRIADVKITLPDDPEADINEVRELLDDSAGRDSRHQ